MSVTNYGELKTAVANWLAKSNLTSYIPDFIHLGEDLIHNELRVPEMESAFSATISSGTIATPTGYREMKFAYIDGSPTQFLTRESNQFIYTKYPTRSSQDKPAYFAREGSSIVFGPYPDSNYTVKGMYYKAFTNMSGDSDTTALLTANFGIYLFAALKEATIFIQDDERTVLWEAKYEKLRDTLNDKAKKEARSGSSPKSYIA